MTPILTQILLELATAYPPGPDGNLSPEALQAMQAVQALPPEQFQQILAELQNGQEVQLSFDEGKHPRGHEGNPGQFAAKGGEKKQPAPRKSTGIIQSFRQARKTHQEAKKAYQQAMESYRQAFSEVKDDASSKLEDMHKSTQGMWDATSNLAWDGDSEDHQSFTDLESFIHELKDNTSVSEIRDILPSMEESLNAAIEANARLSEGAVSTEDDQDWESYKEPNNKALKEIRDHLKFYKKHLKGHLIARREMRDIKSGIDDVNLSLDVLISQDVQLSHREGQPCLPGETATKTGCTPAGSLESKMGGVKPEMDEEDSHAQKSLIQRGIKFLVNTSPAGVAARHVAKKAGFSDKTSEVLAVLTAAADWIPVAPGAGSAVLGAVVLGAFAKKPSVGVQISKEMWNGAKAAVKKAVQSMALNVATAEMG
jgi:hypothetical protein